MISKNVKSLSVRYIWRFRKYRPSLLLKIYFTQPQSLFYNVKMDLGPRSEVLLSYFIMENSTFSFSIDVEILRHEIRFDRIQGRCKVSHRIHFCCVCFKYTVCQNCSLLLRGYSDWDWSIYLILWLQFCRSAQFWSEKTDTC